MKLSLHLILKIILLVLSQIAMNINDLPTEILQRIFSYLTIKQKFRFECVCRRWQQNVFYSIDKLSFEGWEDEFQGRHKHVVDIDRLQQQINSNNKIIKCIILKCGQNLCSFQGTVSHPLMLTMADMCGRLHCIDMEFDGLKSLQLLCDRFGKQLTCATLCVNVTHYLKPFLTACPHLVSLAITSDVCDWSEPEKGPEPDVVLPYRFFSLRDLVIKSQVTQDMFMEISKFTKLQMISINVRHWFTEPLLWKSAMKRWSCLSSLTLQLSCENYVHFDSLPPSLEYLELVACGREYYEDSDPIWFSTFLPKLKTVKIYQFYMKPVSFITVLERVVHCCPNVENLSISFYNGLYGNMDLLLMPLLSLSTLKRLSLSSGFIISDLFASQLIIDLPHLTSLGYYRDKDFLCILPVGNGFWEAFIHKALSCPCEVFEITGIVKETLYLKQQLPSNIYLHVVRDAVINLSNGFGQSNQWQEMTNRWGKLNSLTLELQDIDCNLTGLPTSLRVLKIKCMNENEGTENEALTFTTRLPQLQELSITQLHMSNAQLRHTIECISDFFPKLLHFFIDRGNEETEPVDEYVDRLLHCHCLICLCITQKFVISDKFAAKLVFELRNLTHFGCSEHLLGFNFGSLFLNSLASKAAKGVCVVLTGGPTHLEIKEKANLVKIPRRFRIIPRELPTQLKKKEQNFIANDENIFVKELFDRAHFCMCREVQFDKKNS